MGSVTLIELYKIIDELPFNETGCKIWPYKKTSGGYGRITIKEGGSRRVHRRVLERKLNRYLKPGMFACHTCDNPSCVYENHLWEGSPKDNSKDMKEKGRAGLKGVTGANHPRYGLQPTNKGKPGLSGFDHPMYGKVGPLKDMKGTFHPLFGYKHKPETKQTLSLKNSGLNNPFYNKSHTPEALEKIRLANSAENNHQVKITREQGNEIKKLIDHLIKYFEKVSLKKILYIKDL
jgi:hypothetical protein